MLKNVCFVMTAIAGLVLATGSFAADKPLADRHFNYGAQCATCHAGCLYRAPQKKITASAAVFFRPKERADRKNGRQIRTADS